MIKMADLLNELLNEVNKEIAYATQIQYMQQLQKSI